MTSSNDGTASPEDVFSSIQLRPRPSTTQQTQPDVSVLRPSISISVSSMKQVVQTLENGTPEIRNYLLHECNVIYECKTCLNMFRSLANYISHKRSYCIVRYQDVKHVYEDDDDYIVKSSHPTTAFIMPESIETLVPEKDWDLQEYSPSLTLLKEAGFIEDISCSPLISSLRKPGIESIAKKLKSKAESNIEAKYYVKRRSKERPNQILTLEHLSQSDKAVFQTLSNQSDKSIGVQYVELQKLKQRPSVLMGPDGQIIPPGLPPKNAPSLPSNDSSKENSSLRTRFPCPICRKHFDKIVTVLRHIIHGHHKTMEVAKSMKDEIKENSFLLDLTDQKTLHCIYCQRLFYNSSGRTLHEKCCKARPTDSLIHILNNQPVIKLKKIQVSESRNELNGQETNKLASSSRSKRIKCSKNLNISLPTIHSVT